MEFEQYIVFCTCPNEKVAKEIAHLAVESKLAACVNILPGITSVYSWEGKIESSTEHLLFIKTTSMAYEKLEALIMKAHPYECPEVIGVPIKLGQKGYLQWVENSVLVAS